MEITRFFRVTPTIIYKIKNLEALSLDQGLGALSAGLASGAGVAEGGGVEVTVAASTFLVLLFFAFSC